MTFRGITTTGDASFTTIQRLLGFCEADLNSSTFSLGCTPIRPAFLLHRHLCPGPSFPPSGPGSASVEAAAAVGEPKPASPRPPRAASGAPAPVSSGLAALQLLYMTHHCILYNNVGWSSITSYVSTRTTVPSLNVSLKTGDRNSSKNLLNTTKRF